MTELVKEHIYKFVTIRYPYDHFPDFDTVSKMYNISVEQLCDIIYLKKDFTKEKYSSDHKHFVEYHKDGIQVVYGYNKINDYKYVEIIDALNVTVNSYESELPF